MSDKQVIDFSTILASSVHDMKNSVGMLIASVETLMEESKSKSDEEKRHFQTLHYEASRINGELIQLLSLYRSEKGFLPLNIDEQFVRDILEDQLARNQLLIDTSAIHVELQCDEDLTWYFDADLVGGVIHNILLNCIRYTHSQILVKAEIVDHKLCFSIADDGPGYPEDMLCSPSNRVNEAQMSEGATHLGLYFAEEIASLHKQSGEQGSIRLSNNGSLGAGEFHLFLP
jgi:K+-sensing histidine kinase KdpD